MLSIRSLVLLLGVTGLATSNTEPVPPHQPGYPELQHDYDNFNHSELEYDDFDDAHYGVADYDAEGKLDYGDPPAFAVSPKTFTVKEGDPVIMPCTPKNITYLAPESHYTLIIKKTKEAKEKEDKTIYIGDRKVLKNRRVKLEGGNLEISDLNRNDAGEYVCYFENPKMIEVKHTLVVQYAPRTITHSRSIKTLHINNKHEAIHHELHCEAHGVPVPTIKWTRADGKELPPGSITKEDDVIDTRKISTLNLKVTDRHAEGNYTCTAENGIGQPHSEIMTLRITFPPEITVEQRIVNSGIGDSVHLECFVYGKPKPTTTWTHNKAELLKNEKTRDNGGIQISTKIDIIKSDDLGEYVCNSTNKNGNTQEIVTITDAPSAPLFTSDRNGGEDTRYVLTWNARSYSAITKYNIKCREWHQDSTEVSSDEDSWKDMPDYNAGAAEMKRIDQLTSFILTLSQLKPATDYECYVKTFNEHNWSPGATYVFSTKRNQVALQASTSGGNRIISWGLSAFVSLLVIRSL